MEKTKLGISVELMAVLAVLACYFGGYTGLFLVVGYILIAEKDEWLKKVAVKAAVITFGFAFISAVIYLIPNIVNFVDTILSIITIDFYIPMLDVLINIVNSALNLVEKFVFLIMAFMALKHNSFDIPVVDAFVDKHLVGKAE